MQTGSTTTTVFVTIEHVTCIHPHHSTKARFAVNNKPRRRPWRGGEEWSAGCARWRPSPLLAPRPEAASECPRWMPCSRSMLLVSLAGADSKGYRDLARGSCGEAVRWSEKCFITSRQTPKGAIERSRQGREMEEIQHPTSNNETGNKKKTQKKKLAVWKMLAWKFCPSRPGLPLSTRFKDTDNRHNHAADHTHRDETLREPRQVRPLHFQFSPATKK